MKTKHAAKGKHRVGQPAIAGSSTAQNKLAKSIGASVTKPMDGLAQTYAEGMPRAQTLVADLFQQLSALAALQTLKDEEVIALQDYMAKTFTSERAAVKDIADIIRARALDIVLSHPTEVLPSGTIKMRLPDGRVKEARVQRSGIDVRKLEPVLRARNLPLTTYLTEVRKYEVNDNTMAKLLEDKVFTPDELKQFEHEKSYALQPTKESKE